MGVAPSSPTLPVMSCDELATLAEDNQKTEIGQIIRENEIDGAVAADIDDEMVAEMAPSKIQQLKLKKALTQLKEFFAEKEQGEAQASAAAATGSFEAGTWKFLSAAYIKGLPPDKPLPECRTLETAGVLATLRASDEELLLGEVLEGKVIVSHRWETKEHPDPKCSKLKIIQDYLRSRPDINAIWLDFTCLPQGTKSTEEASFFDYCLKTVNLLYLAGQVVVFVDGQYNTRFWTQFEFFCCTHRGSTRGLVPKSTAEFERRVKMISIGSSEFSDGMDEKSLIAKWSQRTAQEANGILSKDDVYVTSEKDKPTCLKKLLELEERLKAMKAIIPAWTDEAEAKAREQEPQKELAAKKDDGVLSKAEYDKARQETASNFAASGKSGGAGGAETELVALKRLLPEAVIVSQPREEPRKARFNPPPNMAGHPHPDGGNFFWQYYDQHECSPFKYGGCCMVFWCHPCVHGWIRSWAGGDDCLFHTVKWACCPLFVPCFLEEDRKLVERKIFTWHKERGDPRAQGEPFAHPGVCCVGFTLGPGANWIMHAHNWEVMMSFEEVQKDKLQE